MLIFEKLGYNKIQSRYIHEIISKENIKYNENYFNEEHSNINALNGGTKSRKILENSSEQVENVKFIYMDCICVGVITGIFINPIKINEKIKTMVVEEKISNVSYLTDITDKSMHYQIKQVFIDH